jgi:hypothetical protein
VLHAPASTLPRREGIVNREEKNDKGVRKRKKNEMRKI